MKKREKKLGSAENLSENNKDNKIKKYFRENWTKKKVNTFVKKYLILTIANILLALATVLFTSPLKIVSGGLTGIAIVIDNFIPGEWLDIIIYIGEGILTILSFIFLGKKTTFKSLYSVILCPLLITLFTRVLPFPRVVEILYGGAPDATGLYPLGKDTAILLLGGLAGGILTGISVALAFSVGGSTGGVDTIVLIVKKYTKKLRESALCFVIDASIIILGVFSTFMSTVELESYNIIMCLINVLGAFMTAGVIEAMYVMRSSSVTITVISSKWEEINHYIINILDRGSTVYDVFGGYSLEQRKEIKTIVAKKQSEKAKEEILKIDPNAFLTMTISKGVFGEGFQSRFKDE